MTFSKVEQLLSKVINPVVNVLLAIGASVLALMMFLTVVDVIGRYIFNSPIDGAFELIEFMMAIFVPFAFVYCEKQKSHIAVDILSDRLPLKAQKSLAIFTTFMATGFFALISWQSFLAIGDEFTNKLTSSVLLLSTYPFIIPMALAFVVLTFLLFNHLLNIFSSFTGK